MSENPITEQDRQNIEKYFGKPLSELTDDEFRLMHKQLRQKYHPDNFAQFDDETVLEMAKERFQAIEKLAEKIKFYLSNQGTGGEQVSSETERPQYAYDEMKIEIRTENKDLKFRLFGTSYRWLERGDKFKVPGTGAYLIIDDGHVGTSIGFRETIRMYLTFGVGDSLDEIVNWLYLRIEGQASSLIIAGEVVQVDLQEMSRLIRRKSLLQIGPTKE
jgi:hypothetical protein